MPKKYTCKTCNEEIFTEEVMKVLNNHMIEIHGLNYTRLVSLLENFTITEYGKYRNDA